ncbi:Protein NIM1-INTERACTING 1 [Cardamine amara subsp. amara]|uniref:Protein NIM1-INTERACTING 1 n=1 Tax=Cardamine amara subsp. amara TaxID=228776 RepID=A0ABD1AHL7_CARAN
MAIMNKEKKTENKRINEIDEPQEEDEEEEELENKKMDMFFNLIKNYQQAKKRRRLELLIQDSGDAASNPTKRSDSGIVPVFRVEDFSHCTDLNLKPSDSIISTKIQDKEEEEEEEEEEETEKKEIREDNGLDLNLAL